MILKDNGLNPTTIDDMVFEITKENNKQIDGVSEEVLKAFNAYDWPGNIRELRNCIERMVVLCREKTLQIENIPYNIREKVSPELIEKNISNGTLNLENNEKTGCE